MSTTHKMSMSWTDIILYQKTNNLDKKFQVKINYSYKTLMIPEIKSKLVFNILHKFLFT